MEFIGVENVTDTIGYVYDERYWHAVLFMFLFYIKCGAVVINLLLFFNVWLASKVAYDGITPSQGAKMISINTNDNNNSGDNFQTAQNSTEERIRRWQEFYGDCESVKSNNSQEINENKIIRRALSDNQLIGHLPWAYADDPREISTQRNKLTHSVSVSNTHINHSYLTNNKFNLLTGEDVTNF